MHWESEQTVSPWQFISLTKITTQWQCWLVEERRCRKFPGDAERGISTRYTDCVLASLHIFAMSPKSYMTDKNQMGKGKCPINPFRQNLRPKFMQFNHSGILELLNSNLRLKFIFVKNLCGTRFFNFAFSDLLSF